ncbi:hypothetical protein BO82DRAFT_363392 [Aspergillus uvarum CBS 121591]|uniref:Uncharacterized protein n=1 Tax=Aspergillus uvarum CBS 121591 TaxID=1448315 RepID=A0A319CE82_9EURO|nr:hypothetical protein BO82DRAFT_363392 [Aspergillus uvarum CBS 121591]PYH83514.1 hypothetical protein BO82DRAFT_363392 [Aspergillus uvarum CBS 121591]
MEEVQILPSGISTAGAAPVAILPGTGSVPFGTFSYILCLCHESKPIETTIDNVPCCTFNVMPGTGPDTLLLPLFGEPRTRSILVTMEVDKFSNIDVNQSNPTRSDPNYGVSTFCHSHQEVELKTVTVNFVVCVAVDYLVLCLVSNPRTFLGEQRFASYSTPVRLRFEL